MRMSEDKICKRKCEEPSTYLERDRKTLEVNI